MLKIKVKQEELMKALKKVKMCLDGKSEDFNISVEETEDGAIGTITAQNNNLIASASFKLVEFGAGDEAKTTLTKFNLFFKVVENIDKDKEITISRLKDKVEITNKGRLEPVEIITSVKAIEFAEMDRFKDSQMILNGAEFKESVSKIINIPTRGATTSHFDCIHLLYNKKQVLIKGMDNNKSRRMALFSQMVECKGNGALFVDASSLKKVLEFVDDGTLIFGANENFITIKQKSQVYSIRRTTGAYPAIETYLLSKADQTVVFNKSDIVKALKSITAVATKNNDKINFQITGDICNMKIEITPIKLSEHVACTGTSSDVDMNISSVYLLNSILDIDSETLKFGICKNCIIISPEKPKGYLHNILIPCKI